MAPSTTTPDEFRALVAQLRPYLPDLRIQAEPAAEGGEAAGFLVGTSASPTVQDMTPVALTGWRAPSSPAAMRAAVIAGYVCARQAVNARGQVPQAPSLDPLPELAQYRNTAFSDGAPDGALSVAAMFAALCEGTGTKAHAATVARALTLAAPETLDELALAATGLDLDDVPGTAAPTHEAVLLGLVGPPDMDRLAAAVSVLSGPVAARIADSARAGLDVLLGWIAWTGGRPEDAERFRQAAREWWVLPDGADLPLVSATPAWRIAAQD